MCPKTNPISTFNPVSFSSSQPLEAMGSGRKTSFSLWRVKPVVQVWAFSAPCVCTASALCPTVSPPIGSLLQVWANTSHLLGSHFQTQIGLKSFPWICSSPFAYLALALVISFHNSTNLLFSAQRFPGHKAGPWAVLGVLAEWTIGPLTYIAGGIKFPIPVVAKAFQPFRTKCRMFSGPRVRRR